MPLANFPTSLDSWVAKTDSVDDVLAAHVNKLQDAVDALETKVGADSSAVTTSLDYKVNNFIKADRKLWFYEDTAPTGWTIVAAAADALLAVKGGSQAYNATGGTQQGTWTQNHIHAKGTYSLADHLHGINQVGTLDGTPLTVGGSLYKIPYFTAADLNSTNSSPTLTALSGGSSATPTEATWRPLAQVGIICSKD